MYNAANVQKLPKVLLRRWGRTLLKTERLKLAPHLPIQYSSKLVSKLHNHVPRFVF